MIIRTTGVQSEKFIKRKRRQLFFRMSLSVIFVISLVAGLSSLSHWHQVTLGSVVVKGNSVLKSEEITAIADKAMEGEYLYLFSKKNILIYPNTAIQQHLIDTYKRIQSVDVGTTDSNSLVIEVVERQPVALWCDESCYYVDDTGYIFAEAPHFTENVYISYQGKIKDEPIGNIFLPESDFREIRSFVSNLKNVGLEPTTVVAKDHDEFQITIKNPAIKDAEATTGTIFINKNVPFEKTFDSIATFLREYRGRNGAGLKPIEYIDLRFGNNIVFKFR